VVLPLPTCWAEAESANRKPNFVFMVIDDLGWADLGCAGSQYYRTPNIDRLASEGMRFTDAYAACAVCSPTRASTMTGKYPARLHITDWIPGEGDRPKNRLKIPDWRMYLPLEQVTIAEALKAAGYATASIGKWHLGNETYYPEHQGFDLNLGGCHIGHPASYFFPYGAPSDRYRVPGLEQGGRDGEYLTDRLTEEAQKFIRNNRDRPFLLYLAHYAVHTPLQAKKQLVEEFQERPPYGGQNNATYAAMIQSVDESVGAIRRTLAELGIDQRTAILFTSDNGGLWPTSTSNAPLRAGKGFPYEGGIRVPLLIRWPGITKPGSICSEPVSSIDFYPTILEMARASGDRSHNMNVDGVSLVLPLKQAGRLRSRALFWHYPHYWGGDRVQPYGVIRAGEWKLIEHLEDMRVELYNLSTDMAEKTNLADKMPSKRDELRRGLHEWRRSVNAQMPLPK